MKYELEDQLANDFPFMLARNVWDGELCLDEDDNTYGFPCECSDGWYQLIYDLCQELNDLYISKGVDPSEILVMQVKEKFGQLRFYTGGLIDGAHDIISKYEDKSYEVCEVCGDDGTLCIKGGWYRTLCEKHMEEYGYKKLTEELVW